ncbi:MAG: hypothetical protein PHQ52_08040 [Candidatus Omnitrophica bacterium]|nr:hypothetical protein [Candidatus Omnitrophota bacterium]
MNHIKNNLNISLCPDEAILNSYMNKELHGELLAKTEKHVSQCNTCLSKIALASRILGQENNFRFKIKETFMNIFKHINIWAISSLIFFILSFVYPKHFIQFLGAALVLAVKWIVDNKNTKMLIMIHEAWKKEGFQQSNNDLRFKR